MIDSALLARLTAVAHELFAPLPVLAAYAYGSRVSGRPRPDSDLDIGYYLGGYRRGEMLRLRDEMALTVRLSDALGIEVDLRNLGGAPLDVRGRVLEEGIRIYSGDAVERVSLERELLGRYHDYKDTFARMHAERLCALAERGL